MVVISNIFLLIVGSLAAFAFLNVMQFHSFGQRSDVRFIAGTFIFVLGVYFASKLTSLIYFIDILFEGEYYGFAGYFFLSSLTALLLVCAYNLWTTRYTLVR